MRIEIRGLTKKFDTDKEILKSIDFSDDIETLAIIGPSGDGKSTLLRIIGGLLLKTSGQLWVDNEEMTDNEELLVAYRRKIGFVFQNAGLFKHMTAMQNITVPLVCVHGFSENEARVAAKKLLDRFGLLDDANKKPQALSGGQQQRIAIARAVASRPKIVLFDEPTSALDPLYTTEVLDMINELKNDGMNFIIVTHEMGFARHACEKVAFLNSGNIIEYGKSNEIFENPKTEELRKFLSKLLEWKI